MTQHSAFHYTCDSKECGVMSGICENSYTLPEGWASILWKVKETTTNVNLCPGCTEALRDMMSAKNAVKLTEDYYK